MAKSSKPKPQVAAQPPSESTRPPVSPTGLKIIRLRAENVMRLTAIDLRPDGETVIVGGENGAGKTSVLTAIWIALGGKEAQPPEPLRRGAEKGAVELDLGELIVRRTFTPGGGGTLTVRNREGAVYPSPQAILDRLVGDLSFDPLAFTRMRGGEQAELLRRLTGVDFGDLDAARAEIYAARTEVGRELRALEGQLAGSAGPVAGEEVPSTEVSVAELTEQLLAAQRIAQENDLAKRQAAEKAKIAADSETTLKTAVDRIVRLREELAQAESHRDGIAIIAKDTRTIADKAMKEIAKLVDPDLAPIEAALRGAEETNRKVRAAAHRAQLAADADGKRSEIESLTTAIGELDAEREAALAAAPFPVPGLGFGADGGGVTLNGIPFEQASATEQLMVSLAVGAALNPRLRVLLVRDASLLTPKNRAVLIAWCERENMQGFIELAGESGEMTVVIADGAVRE